MSGSVSFGLLLTAIAGLLSGNCMLPMKFARRWPWENTWLVFSLVSLVVLPWGLALATVSNIGAVYAALPQSAFLPSLLFGAGWGVAQVLFGMSISRLGLALGYAIIIGLGALLGTVVPLVVNHGEVISTSRGTLIVSGIAVMAGGITVSARAGLERERDTEAGTAKENYPVALLLAVVCGLMAPMLNYAFAFGQSIARSAVLHGTSPEAASYAVWPVALLGGLIPNLAYCFMLLCRNRTWKQFRGAWRPDALYGCLMGVFWMGAVGIYGLSSVYLGPLGTSLGWALFQIFMIMTANVSGVLTGEWKNTPPHARRGLAAGLALLSVATVMIASGNQQP